MTLRFSCLLPILVGQLSENSDVTFKEHFYWTYCTSFNQSLIYSENKPSFSHFERQSLAMPGQVELCESCELDYFYVIGKYHGGIFPGHDAEEKEESMEEEHL